MSVLGAGAFLHVLALPALGEALTVLGARRAASTSLLRGGRLRGGANARAALATAADATGAGLRLPDPARWRAFFDAEGGAPPATTLLVVQKEGYGAWLAGRPEGEQAWLNASGLDAFADDAFALLPPGGEALAGAGGGAARARRGRASSSRRTRRWSTRSRRCPAGCLRGSRRT